MGLPNKILIIGLIILSFSMGFYLNGRITGASINIQNTEADIISFTKAICDYENNSCVDVKISCLGDKVVGIELSSDIKKFPVSWEDPRTVEEISKLCSR